MKPPVVLLADPNSDRRARLATILRDIGCELGMIPDPDIASAWSARTPPALVVLGVPDTTPFDVFDVVRKLRDGDRRLPVILIVRNASAATAVAALRAGVKDYLCEPLDAGTLQQSARRWLSARET